MDNEILFWLRIGYYVVSGGLVLLIVFAFRNVVREKDMRSFVLFLAMLAVYVNMVLLTHNISGVCCEILEHQKKGDGGD